MSRFAQQVLAVVHRLQGKAYGYTIRRELVAITGGDVSFGATHVMLDQLESKGWVLWREGEATPENGGQPRRYYEITPAGEQALIEQEQYESGAYV
jgi:PadR family transcriptional regulator PadR